MDTSVLGATAAKCMDTLESAHLDDAKIEVVMIVLSVVDADGEKTFTRTFCSRTSSWEKLGILHAGIDCLLTGHVPEDGDEEAQEDE